MKVDNIGIANLNIITSSFMSPSSSTLKISRIHYKTKFLRKVIVEIDDKNAINIMNDEKYPIGVNKNMDVDYKYVNNINFDIMQDVLKNYKSDRITKRKLLKLLSNYTSSNR